MRFPACGGKPDETRRAAGLIALLTAIRFGIEGRRFDLMLCGGFSVLSLSWVAFAIGPAIARSGGG